MQDLSTCKPLGLDVATWLAVFTALAGVLFFVGGRVIRWRSSTRSGGYNISRTIQRSRFHNLCRSIKPLMDENHRIFSQFGPNGGRGNGLPKAVRFELGVWYQLRQQIVDNNAEIRSMITANMPAVPQQYSFIFNRWLDHIDAFRAHVLDGAADYREHQFPREVSEIVMEYG